jgi:four helix bundle protein
MKEKSIQSKSYFNKEARETNYWIRLLTETSYLEKDESKILENDIPEILRIIAAIQITLQANNS